MTQANRETRLSIIVVSHNTCEHLLNCLQSLKEHPSVHKTEVIVVDNASSDGSAEEVSRLFRSVRLLDNEENVGYSRGVNQGIRSSVGEFLLIINPDITVKEGSLDRLINYAIEHPDVGIAGAKLLNPDGSIQLSCRTFYTLKTFLYRRTPLGRIFPDSPVLREHLMVDWDHNSARDVDWMLGACLLVRRSAVEDVGLMDERFFLYFEDVDWCYRMRSRGWRVVYVADSQMLHLHRRESAGGLWNRRALIHLGSMLRFYDKWSHFLYRLKSRRHLARFFLSLVTDLVAISSSFLLAYGIRLFLGAIFTKPVFPLSTYAPFLMFVNVTTLISLFSTGFYEERPGLSGASLITDRFLRALRASGLAYLVVTASTFLAQSQIYSRILVTISFVLLPVLVTAGRYFLHLTYQALRRGAYDLRRAIVVGADDLAKGMADQLRTFPDIGFDLVGFVRESEQDGIQESGELGNAKDLPRLVREHRVSDVFFIGKGDPLPVVSKLLLRLADAPVTVRVVSDLSAITMARGSAEEFLNLPMLRFDRRNLVRYRAGRKRLADFLLSLTGAIITLPLLLVLLLLSTLAGTRPLLAWEERAHFRGAGFRLPRLRAPDDGRALAGLLRKLFRRAPILTSLPKLYPVLFGRFSFVGPSPQEPESGRFLDEWQRLLVTLKPGLLDVTAIADHPWVPFRDPVGLNLYYLQCWSISLDFQIVLRDLIRSLSAGAKIDRTSDA